MTLGFHLLRTRRRTGLPGDTDYLPEDPVCQGAAESCPLCGNPISLLPWLPPHRAVLEQWDSRMGDVAYGSPEDLLVSERFRACFISAGLRGLLGFEPVEIVRVERKAGQRGPVCVPRMFHARVSYSMIEIEQAASGFEWSDPATICSGCHRNGMLKRWRAVVFRESTWDGLDVFLPRMLRMPFVSERFRTMCLREQLLNTSFTRSEEYGWDFYPWERIDLARAMFERALTSDLLENRCASGLTLRFDTLTGFIAARRDDGTIEWVDRPSDPWSLWKRKQKGL